ncbi:Rrf2 family transcriptional regulator [Yersinia ruckeri]|uniref:Rrf2 family transcriptional regulator n=1 Tax=Yersinia ruckeri TaxID=29486 RepID=UPI0022380F79|nr:Rrf2 family transcriptional regulator [Yersinia ruckeri]EKN4700419.1 Rrf2 family transcriptional regulator [Yersinia ruckeri]MCW6563833.1 Rrf2 family transcriptional regulator [Yersinia ruckeri]MCW6573509.1 Rrf2 family transcriptional regulator [Yersinia ruckeri]UZX67231.1 Rrf2 family transcriptional regulator [Yersinia ruckeri]
MEINCIEGGRIIWMRNLVTSEGMTSNSYLKDGTQEKIIAALEEALLQAKGEQSCRNNAD